MGAPSILVITTPKALIIVPKNNELCASNLSNFIYALIYKTNGAMLIYLINVFAPYFGIYMSFHLSTYLLTR